MVDVAAVLAVVVLFLAALHAVVSGVLHFVHVVRPATRHLFLQHIYSGLIVIGVQDVSNRMYCCKAGLPGGRCSALSRARRSLMRAASR